jgi:hypothetical protein
MSLGRTYVVAFLVSAELFLGFSKLAAGKNRNPDDYPQKANVVSFQRQPCLHQAGGRVRVCHFITFQVDGQTLTGSCSHCDPLDPGETYPARLDRKELVLYVIHKKDNGSWGQDNYTITDMSAGSGGNTSQK